MRYVKILAVLAVLASFANPVGAAEPVKPVLIGIYAQDYDATVAWYSANFGFEVTREVVNDDVNLRIGFLDNGAFELEIYADITPPPGRPRLTRDRFGMPSEGYVKLSLWSADLATLTAALRGNGVEWVRDINTSDRKPGQSWFMIADPDGNLIQVFGPTENR
jgi:catechol 2,3-dioxygenase-like lactoylglutathione lyase family enzyme